MWFIISDLSYIICALILIISIIFSIKDAVSLRDSRSTINELLKSTATLITVGIIFNSFNYFNNGIEGFLIQIDIGNRFVLICKLASFVLIYVLMQTTIYLILKIVNGLVSSNSRRILDKNIFILILSSGFIGFLRGTIRLIFIFIFITLINTGQFFQKDINLFENIKLYRSIQTTVSLEKVNVIKKDLVKEISEATITYYNGVTLEEGIKSNEAIDEKAQRLVKDAKTDREKAKILYAYIGNSIEYDNRKADALMSEHNRKVNNSGAIEAFETGRGVCFDYACLYVAMCRAVGLKVELVMGDAFDGNEFVSHSWNRVYIKDEGIWINVDPTFYNAGNYFGNKDFDKDHINSKIVGEW